MAVEQVAAAGRCQVSADNDTCGNDQLYIYLGTIPPHKIIDLILTPETMLPGVEKNIASAIEEGDFERIAAVTKIRDQMKALQPDDLINLVVS